MPTQSRACLRRRRGTRAGARLQRRQHRAASSVVAAKQAARQCAAMVARRRSLSGWPRASYALTRLRLEGRGCSSSAALGLLSRDMSQSGAGAARRCRVRGHDGHMLHIPTCETIQPVFASRARQTR